MCSNNNNNNNKARFLASLATHSGVWLLALPYSLVSCGLRLDYKAVRIYSYLYSYILQTNEQNIKISIKQTQTQPQYSMSHGQRMVMTLTPLTRDQKIKILT